MPASPTVFNSKLYPDISDIIKLEKGYQSVFKIETKLHTELLNLDYSDGILLENLSITRNYVDNIGDYIEVQLSIPVGTFIHDVYDYLDNIEITIITTKQKSIVEEPVIDIERYKAIYLLDKNKSIPNLASYKKDDLNNQLPFSITFQLLDRSVETIRVKTTQGNFDSVINKNKDMNIGTFFKSVISEQANKILIENKPILDGLTIEEIDNKDNLKSITIPSNTRIVELPKLIQDKNIGVYSGGIGIYIQKFGKDFKEFKKILFIYSLYNSDKYEKSEHKVIFYSPLNNSISNHDSTYKYEEGILRILPMSITKLEDTKESQVMSYGNGFRVSNANSFMKKPVIVSDKGVEFKKDKLVSEIAFKDRLDGLNYAPNKGIATNQFYVISDILKRNGSYVELQVSNLDIDFIIPGSKCKIVYEGKDDIKEIYGIIHIVHVNYSSTTSNIAMNYNNKTVTLTTNVYIKVFITNK